VNAALLILTMILTTPAHAGPAPKPAPKAVAKAATKAPAAAPPNDLNAMKRALASTGAKGPSDPARLDPNAALEVRGQSRTLSMMLVLKNGKEAINFIKVRKDYRPEITTTPY
jgi:hypothetical protein